MARNYRLSYPSYPSHPSHPSFIAILNTKGTTCFGLLDKASSHSEFRAISSCRRASYFGRQRRSVKTYNERALLPCYEGSLRTCARASYQVLLLQLSSHLYQQQAFMPSRPGPMENRITLLQRQNLVSLSTTSKRSTSQFSECQKLQDNQCESSTCLTADFLQ